MTIERKRPNRSVIGIGEAMVEFAPLGDNLYRRGFAGDTLNTCWHIAQILGRHGRVGYFTRVGADAFSTEFLSFLSESGVVASAIVRDPERSIGLYVISLAGAERSFSYWRDSSAARRLAEDFDALLAAVEDASLIHVSGITLAIIGEAGRRNLRKALDAARSHGSRVSFDPNARPRLWRDAAEMRNAFQEAFEVTDIALPSFDDEAALWGDATPAGTVERIAGRGVGEIVVKNGQESVAVFVNGSLTHSPTPAVSEIRDTTGAGDFFNAGYLAGRLVDMTPLEACQLGQAVAAEIISCFGALAPDIRLERFRSKIRQHLEAHRQEGMILMLMRVAFFEGAIRPGRETEFDRYVQDKLLPIWRQTPHALRVEVMREVDADEGAHRFPLVLQISYPDRKSLEDSLASSIRSVGREATRGLQEFFDGRIFHAIYDV